MVEASGLARGPKVPAKLAVRNLPPDMKEAEFHQVLRPDPRLNRRCCRARGSGLALPWDLRPPPRSRDARTAPPARPLGDAPY